ncbi:MAG: ABC-2 type transporter [Microgenomates group bacterium GW2011_GWA1_48_10]|nr:MAG: ABC-2 type transporter [Microgenomates group bacterium GW2011_GWA1_48_10]
MEIIIRPKSVFNLDFKEIWHYRELFYVFAWRDIKVRYKQTVLGISWALFQPLVTTGIFSIFFGKIAKIPSDHIPYPLFVLTGLVFWSFFSNSVTAASQSMVASENIIKKVYFPRLIIPLSSIVTAGLDFLISFLMLLLVMVYYRYFPQFTSLLVLPVLLLTLILTAGGIGLFTSAINVKYRDVRYILPFFIQIGLFVTPIIYPISVILDYRKWLLILNPLTSVIETARALYSGKPINYFLISLGFAISVVIFSLGLYYFRKTEAFFADVA